MHRIGFARANKRLIAKRAVLAWLYFALYLPILSIFAAFYQWIRIGDGRVASYDEKLGSHVAGFRLTIPRVVVFCLIFLSTIFLLSAVSRVLDEKVAIITSPDAITIAKLKKLPPSDATNNIDRLVSGGYLRLIRARALEFDSSDEMKRWLKKNKPLYNLEAQEYVQGNGFVWMLWYTPSLSIGGRDDPNFVLASVEPTSAKISGIIVTMGANGAGCPVVAPYSFIVLEFESTFSPGNRPFVIEAKRPNGSVKRDASERCMSINTAW